MLPSLVIMALFMFYPLIRAAWLSLTSYSFFGTSKFIGLGNYGHLLHDSQFWTDLGNTAYYAAVATPVSIVLALGLALLLNRRRLPGRGVLRAAIFLPAVVSLAVAAIPFRLLFTPSIGLITYWLGLDRHSLHRLAGQHHAGHARGHHRRHLEERRLLHGDLPRRAADDPAASSTRRPASTARRPGSGSAGSRCRC